MTINLENYVIDEDGNGDLVIQDPGGATVLTWDDSASNWLLGDSVDAQGNDLNSVGSINTENIGISNFSHGWTHIVYPGENEYAAIDRTGEVVYGGPDSIGVNDATDFAEIFASIVNNYGDRPAVWLAPPDANSFQPRYLCKSTQTLDRVFKLKGGGRNINVSTTDDVANSDVFTLDSPVGATVILQINDLKFTGRYPTTPPDRFFNLTSVREVQILNCEFRSTNEEGIRATDAGPWNTIQNSWFLDGSGFYFQGTTSSGGIRLTANEIANPDTTAEVVDFGKVIETGTMYRDHPGVTATNVGRHIQVGEETDVDSLAIAGTQLPSHSSEIDPDSSEKLFPDVNLPVGFLFVTVGAGRTAIFAIEGAQDDTELIHDPRGVFSTTEGNSGTSNIYWDSSNGQYEIENGLGSSVTHRRLLIGSY